MNTPSMIATLPMLRFFSGSIAALALSMAAHAAGPLTPPGVPGNPAADMPSLVEIQATVQQGKTLIPPQTSTYTISQPGNYLLTGDITVSSGHGVVIGSGDVTLDLNGFTISSTASSSVHSAIYLASMGAISVKNGRIKNPAGAGFMRAVSFGIDPYNPFFPLILEDLTITNADVYLRYTSGSFGVVICRRLCVSGGGINVFNLNPAIPLGTLIECQATGSLIGAHAINCTAGVGVVATTKVGCSPP